MARLRLLCVAVIAVLSVGVFSDGTTALGAHAQTHKQAHRAARCGKSARSHKRHGQHARRAKRHRRVRCAKRHSTTLKHSAGKSKPTTGGSRSKAHRPARSKSADNGCADAGLEPTPQNVERVRDATLCLINRERAAHGENPLRANQHLQQAAQDHTESMVVGNYFEHLGPGGQTPLQRMRAAGYIYSSQLGYSVGENIAWGTLWLGTPRSIVAAWMASPGHRANILDARYRDTGIGVSSHPPRSLAGGQGGGIYTQDFGVLVGG